MSLFKRYYRAPKIAVNLISLGTLLKAGFTVKMHKGQYAIVNGKTMVLQLQIKSNVLVMDQESSDEKPAMMRDVVMVAKGEWFTFL